MVDFSKYSKYPKILRNDKFSVKSRFEETDNPDGSTSMAEVPSNIADEACHVYVKTADTVDTSKEESYPKKITVKVFCDSSLLVKKGDIVTANKRGVIYEGKVSDPIKTGLGLSFEILVEGEA